MKKIFYKIKFWFHTDYMLSMWYDNDELSPRNIYGLKLMLMLGIASKTTAPRWKLHQRGPFGRSEHLILEGHATKNKTAN